MKRLWCERLACGHIVGVLSDGTMLLCTLNYGHKDQPCMFEGIIQVSCGTESAVGKVGLGERHGRPCLQGKDGRRSDMSSRSETQQSRAGLGAGWGIQPAGIQSGGPA